MFPIWLLHPWFSFHIPGKEMVKWKGVGIKGLCQLIVSFFLFRFPFSKVVAFSEALPSSLGLTFHWPALLSWLPLPGRWLRRRKCQWGWGHQMNSAWHTAFHSHSSLCLEWSLYCLLCAFHPHRMASSLLQFQQRPCELLFVFSYRTSLVAFIITVKITKLAMCSCVLILRPKSIWIRTFWVASVKK